jgi:hypothetical protein
MGTYGKLMELNQPLQVEKNDTQEPTSEGINAPIVEVQPERATPKPSQRDTKQPRYQATMTPRYRDTTIEVIRAAVKVFGKEAATHRFTLEEKKALRDIVYAYEAQGMKTNENEISRIGVNFLIEDYRQNGENSTLHKVLSALKR